MGFDVTPTVTQDWTNNIDALETGVNRLRPGGGTALFDAVYTACRDKLLDVSRGQEPVRKAIVLLSDGDDNQSRVYLDEAIKECERAETIIYAISTNWTPSRGKGDKVLTQMAEETGGQVFFPPSVEEVSEQLQRHRRRAAQPVRADLYAGGLQDTNGAFRVPSISIATTGATRHWFVAYDQGGELRVSGWNSRNKLRLGSKHLCGQTCLHKLVDNFMAQALSAPALPSEEVVEQAAGADSSLTSKYGEIESSARQLTPPALVPSARPPLRLPVELVPLPAKVRSDPAAALAEEMPRYASRNWRAEAWDRERVRASQAGERRPMLTALRRSGS
jgi:hypothetical protein